MILFLSLAALQITLYVLSRIDLRQTERNIMKTLDEVLADVADESTVIDSLAALTTGIKKQLDDVLAGQLPAATQAKVDAIFAAVETNKAKAAAAITENTPAAPPA